MPSARTLRLHFPELPRGSASRMVRLLDHPPWEPDRHRAVDAVLDAFDQAIGGHGVEAIRGTDCWDPYYGDIALLYVNRGDSYTPTLVFDTRAGCFRCRAWGDLVERNPEAYL